MCATIVSTSFTSFIPLNMTKHALWATLGEPAHDKVLHFQRAETDKLFEKCLNFLKFVTDLKMLGTFSFAHAAVQTGIAEFSTFFHIVFEH